MSDEIVNEVLDRLDSLAETAGEGAAAGFEIIVKQMLLHGVVWAIFGLAFATIGVLIWRKFKKEEDPVGKGIGVVFFLISIPFFMESLLRLINPEYYAIQKVVDFL